VDGAQGILISIVLAALSGCVGLMFSRRSLAGQWLTTLIVVAGCFCGLWQLAQFCFLGLTAPVVRFASPIEGVDAALGLDSLSAIFLVPIFLIGMLGSIYGLGYWKQTEHLENGRKLRLFYGLAIAGMATLVMARNGVTFLCGWEVMALSAFFLVSAEDDDPDVRATGWLYLASSHFATLSLFCLFPLMACVSGRGMIAGFDFLPLDGLSPKMATAIFLLALVGFGTKAGLMPMHFWLPSSHAMAPSHVSALMSCVIIKMGIYGLVRVLSLLPMPPVWWGGTLLTLGSISAVLGLAFAIGQQDLKRVLAYSSVENIGIICMGLGLAMVGRSLEQPTWVLLGLAGGLLHVWNHSLFKAIMFLGAGSLVHSVKTREIDRMGGILKKMPATGLLFLVGAVAVCALPPLNGFVSELLIYVGLFRTMGLGGGADWDGASFAAPALALTGALAVACFVRVYGAVFLGSARSETAQHAHESPPTMIAPMALLAVCCFAIGLMPDRVMPLFEDAARFWQNLESPAAVTLSSMVPLHLVGMLSIAFLAALLIGGAALWLRLKTAPIAETGTWDCGYAAPTARMQYTASSFGQMLAELFGWALRWKGPPPVIEEFFPKTASFRTEVSETVLDKAVLPGSRAIAHAFSWSRWLQQGSVQAYLLYMFALLVFLLLTI
jgi:hydrogenase-4 component B